MRIGAPALPYVAQLLEGTDQQAMGEAADILGESGAAGKPYLPKLAAAIPRYHGQPSSIVTAMSRIDAEGSVPLIIPLTHDRKTRKSGIAALEQLSKNWLSNPHKSRATDEIVSILTDALDDPDEEIRIDAVRGFEYLGPLAKAALPRLHEVLNKTPENTNWPGLSRIELERAIGRIEELGR